MDKTQHDKTQHTWPTIKHTAAWYKLFGDKCPVCGVTAQGGK